MKPPTTPQYSARNIDQKIIEIACQWNNSPREGSRRAGFLGLEASPDSAASDLLRYVTTQLNTRAFKAIYVDAARNYPNEVPNALAAALHEEFAGSRARVVLYKIRQFWNCSWSQRLQQVSLFAVVSGFWFFWQFTESKWYKPPYLNNFHHYLMQDLALQLLNLLGVTTVVQILLAFFRSGKLPFDSVAQSTYKQVDGYIQALSSIGGRLPVALLIDNANKLSPWPEIEAINKLLGIDAEPESIRNLPHGFRIFIAMVNPPNGLALSGKHDLSLQIPDLLPEAARQTQQFLIRVKHQVDVFLSDQLRSRKPGILGVHEWTAYEMEIGRPLDKPEREKLYAQVRTSRILPLLGFADTQPSKCPKTIFSRLNSGRETLYPIYAMATAQVLEQSHQRELRAWARLLLLVEGLDCVGSSSEWTAWSPTVRRAVIAAADHAEDLSFSDSQGSRVIDLLQATGNDKRKLLAELMEILVTAGELKKAMGHLGDAADYFQAAARWYTDAIPVLNESLQNRFFYGLWDCFWLSCDREQRDAIFRFEREHPDIRKINAWKILKNRERRFQGKHLLPDVEDPGPAWPELGNLYQLTHVAERLETEYAYDFDAAASAENFDFGKVYPESRFTSSGMTMASTQSNLICRRQNDTVALDNFLRTLTERFLTTEPVFCGERLLMECEILLSAIDKPWVTKDRDLDAVAKSRSDIVLRLLALRRYATVIGFGEVVRRLSYPLGSLLTFTKEESLSLAVLKEWPDAERFLQEVLDIESRVGWVRSSLDVYLERLRLAGTNLAAVVDDAVAFYDASKQARRPLFALNEALRFALEVSANNATNEGQLGECIRLHEEAARLTAEGKRPQDFWDMLDKEEECVHLLSFAAHSALILEDIPTVHRILGESEKFARIAEAARPGTDGVRQSWQIIWLMRTNLALKAGDVASARSWRAQCWSSLRPRDVNASYVYLGVLEDEEELGIASVACTFEASGDYQGARLNEEFVSRERLTPRSSIAPRYEWRLCVFAQARESLEVANSTSFFRTALKLAGVCEAAKLSMEARNVLLGLLEAAEKFFAHTAPSNSEQSRCLEYIRWLDPARSEEIDRRLNEIAEEDLLLEKRVQVIADAIQSAGPEAALQGVDNESAVTRFGRRGQLLLDVCRSLIARSEDLLAQGNYARVVARLERHARQWKPSHASWARLRLTHLWLKALEQDPEAIGRTENAKHLIGNQSEDLLRALLPEQMNDRQLLGDYRSELWERLEEAYENSPAQSIRSGLLGTKNYR